MRERKRGNVEKREKREKGRGQKREEICGHVLLCALHQDQV